MDTLTDQQLTLLGDRLREMRDALRTQLDSGKKTTDVVTLDQSLVGRLSRMDAMQQQQMAISTQKKAQQRLQRVELALAALDAGEYGYCRQCDEDIGFPRLEAQPDTPLCFACQSRRDQQQ
ncbi:MAG: TraR/DksA family transcriptional regulator [Pseudohongiellaceae bacterium]